MLDMYAYGPTVSN